ncbi:MAG: CoA-binding protein [Desulfomonile tiedjei]|nr:CoA-binding protein [Desulfomonile tiedjei]
MTLPDKPDDAALLELLGTAKTIAVVGLSANTSKASHQVAKYLQQKGYRIIPVNPATETVLGEKSYPDLRSVPVPVDVVDVFRRSEFTPDIARQAAAIGAKVLWLQLGIRNDEAARIAAEAGLAVVQDACMLQEHARLVGTRE